MRKYITREELRKELIKLVDSFLDSLKENQKIHDLTLLTEVEDYSGGVTFLHSNATLSNYQSTNLRYGEWGNTYKVLASKTFKSITGKDKLFTNSTREFLKDLELDEFCEVDK